MKLDLVWGAFVLMAFVAAMLLVQALLTLWQARYGRAARRLEQRLQALAGGASSETSPLASSALALRERAFSRRPWLDAWLRRLAASRRVDAWLVQSGLPWSVADLGGLMATGSALLAVGAAALGLKLPAVVLAAIMGAVLAPAWAQLQRERRLTLLATQLPDALDLIARAMQAGHSFSSALLLAGTDGPQPIAREFHTVFDEMHYGASTDAALAHLADRMPGSDVRFLVAAVLLQSQTGGNLAQVLQTIAALMRERQRLRGQIRVLAAEGRLSAWILTLLPFGLAGALLAVNAEFISTLWKDPLGLRITLSALALMVLGVAWMWQLVRIRV